VRSIDRRQFLHRAIAAGAGGAVLPLATFAPVRAQGAAPGDSPYGPLATEPDENGLLLPEGFTSRVLAVAGELVEGTDHAWHAFPDGAATFPTDDGGWIYVCNSEVTSLVANDAGGVSAVRFDAEGAVVDAYPILEGSTSNCAGGPTPWGTWLSCEEPLDKKGRLWECDPTGEREAVAHEAMGLWNREAAAVDPEGEAVYMTEDDGIGLLYRYTPTAYPDLSEGLLEAALIDADGNVTWAEVPDPSAATEPTNAQVPGAARFDGGEGIWYHDGAIFFTTKGDDRVHRLDLAEQVHTVLWDGDPEELGVEGAVLSGVDNITVDPDTGDLFVAEDGGNLEVVVLSAEGTVAPFLRLVDEAHEGSELTGPCLSPDRTRMYVSSQRGPSVKVLRDIVPGASEAATAPNGGITYEITGPFRTVEAEPEATTTTAAGSDEGASSDAGDGDGGGTDVVPFAIGGAALAAVVAGAVALRRRGEASS
jgi:secreted PhoX family phosphatase